MIKIMTPFLLDLKHGNKETAQPYAPDIDRRRKPAIKKIHFIWLGNDFYRYLQHVLRFLRGSFVTL